LQYKKHTTTKQIIQKVIFLKMFFYNMYILRQTISLLISISLYLVFIYQYKNSLLSCYFFQEDYENLKGSMSWYLKYVSRNVQKSVQGDGQRNGHNCIAGGAISTTTCFKCM
jgi:hypothetical protein